MKWIVFFLFTLSIAFSSCNIDKREDALDQREIALNEREQELLLKEKSLELKAEELAKREQVLDSTSKSAVDTLSALHPNLAGLWNVTMRCTQTTCAGSAVGDTKTEQWEIVIQNNTVIAKAMSDKKLVRIYSGSYLGKTFQLIAQQENPQQATKIVVRLQPTQEQEMTGQREIIRDDCRIVYSLELKKQ